VLLFAVLQAVAVFAPRPAVAADMKYPLAVAVDGQGTIFVADNAYDFHGIWKIAEGKRELFFEASRKFRTPLNAVRCVAIDKQGRLVAGDSATREIYRFADGNKPVGLTQGKNAGIGIPMAIAFDSKGDIYVADLEIQRIVKVPEAGGEAVEFAQVNAARGLAMDDKDNLWVVSAVAKGKDQVLRIAPDGKIEPVVKNGPFELPHHIALDGAGNAYVCDNYAVAVWKVPPDGVPVKLAEGKPLVRPVGIAWQKDRLIVADPHAKGLFEVTADGKVSPISTTSAGK
jgi:sugar lactone lactonase YvrE